MPVKRVPKSKPPFPFEAYSHVVSPLSMDDGGGFLFTMPDFPGLLADGESVEQAVKDGRAAFASVVSALSDAGREPPAPTLTGLDFSPAPASGRFVTHVPRSIHGQLALRTKAEGVSLNALVLTLIAEGLGRRAPRA